MRVSHGPLGLSIDKGFDDPLIDMSVHSATGYIPILSISIRVRSYQSPLNTTVGSHRLDGDAFGWVPCDCFSILRYLANQIIRIRLPCYLFNNLSL